MAPNPIDADFDAVVGKALKDWHAPGISVSVVHDENTWSKAYGLAQRSPETKVETNTLFYAASTTKAQLCAAWAIYIKSEANQKKAEDERIKWSTPLADIIGDDFVLEDPVRTRQITLEDAVSHRTGMARHELCYGKEGPSSVKAVTRHLRHLPLHNTLRTHFEYCNTMYMAATHALETVTGKSLSDILHEWLWEPLGMKQTYLGYGEAAKVVKEKGCVLAKGYYWTKLAGSEDYHNGDFKEQPYMDFPEVAGAGAVISTADDYAKWMRCLLSSSAPLSEDITKEVWTSRSTVTEENDMQSPFDGNLLNYGLGWFICSYQGYKVLYHPGGIIGAGSLIMLVPELKWGMSFFSNGNDVGAILRGLPFALLDKVLGLPEEKRDSMRRVEEAVLKQYEQVAQSSKDGKTQLYPNAPSKPSVSLTLPIEAYAGTYRGKAYGRLTFSLQDGDDGTKKLHCLVDNKTWTTVLTLEHVNAEFWLGSKKFVDSSISRPFRAESKVGVDGKVEWFGLGIEEAMENELIWFKRDG